MGPLHAEVELDVPRQVAFDFVADLSNRPAFTDHFISDLRLSRIASTGVGAGARFRIFAPPQAIWMDSTIVALDPPHRISERGSGGRAGRTAVATEWEFEAGPGPLVTARVTYWTRPGHSADRLKETLLGASFWYRRDWETAMRRLRGLLESDPAEDRGPGVAGGNRYLTGVP
ncbi:MAG: SRPBCC family protein [Solirubrobacterales bacterium]